MRIKFFIFLIIAIVTIHGLFFMVLKNAEQIILQEKKEMLKKTSDTLSEKIDKFLYYRIVDLISFSTEYQNIEDINKNEQISNIISNVTIYTELQKNLEKYLKINNDFTSLEIVDLKGKILAYGELDKTDKYNNGILKKLDIEKINTSKENSYWFQNIKNLKGENKYTITDAHFSENNNDVILEIAVPIKNNNNEFLGAVMGVINMSEVSSIIDSTFLGKTGKIIIYNKDGYIISNIDKDKLFKKLIGYDTISTIGLNQKGSGVVIENSKIDNSFITVYKILNGHDLYTGLGWGIQITQDTKEVLEYTNLINELVFLLIITAIIFFVFLYIWLDIDLFKPLIVMQKGYESIANGDLNTYIDYKRKTNTEINNLFIYFNKMVKQLKKNNDFLEQYSISEITAREKIIEELKQISKSKDDFINIASHELRTPMTVIKGYISMILDGDAGKISDEMSLYLKKVLNGANGLIALINDMLDIAKLESGKMEIIQEPVDIGKLFLDIYLDMSQVSNTKQQNIEINVDYENIIAMVDSGKIKQVFVNLIGNAIKFTPEKGIIKIHSFIENEFIITNITDTGIGIEKEFIDKIFDKFIQIKNSTTRDITGTGLGLPIVKIIVEKMGGNVSVESTIGKGTTFIVKIPFKKAVI